LRIAIVNRVFSIVKGKLLRRDSLLFYPIIFHLFFFLNLSIKSLLSLFKFAKFWEFLLISRERFLTWFFYSTNYQLITAIWYCSIIKESVQFKKVKFDFFLKVVPLQFRTNEPMHLTFMFGWIQFYRTVVSCNSSVWLTENSIYCFDINIHQKLIC
jgi:hypothetical protein